MSLKILIWLTLILCKLCQSNHIGHRVILSDAAKDYGAMCLDGTPGNYYFANGTQSKKYVIFFQGGGWCSGLFKANGKGFNSCWSRHTTSDGTTKNDASTIDMNQHAYLGFNKTTNPLFYNWNKVYLRYCDGASFGGDLTNPVVTNQSSQPYLYYRGKRIMYAVFDSLVNDYGLADATDIVIGGGSAGGLASYNHFNFIVDNFLDTTKQKVVGLPDVGYFLEYNGINGDTNYSNGMQWVYNNQNISSSIADADECYNNPKLKPDECIFAQNMARSIKIPVFVLNSQYDAWQCPNILGSNNATLINEYGKNFTNLLINNFLSYSNESNGIVYGGFIDGCYHHAAENPAYWSGLNIDGYSQATAFSQFYDQLDTGNYVRTFWYQNVSYPCKTCCPSSVDLEKENSKY